jgi:hypothetical protein
MTGPIEALSAEDLPPNSVTALQVGGRRVAVHKLWTPLRRLRRIPGAGPDLRRSEPQPNTTRGQRTHDRAGAARGEGEPGGGPR